MKRLYGHAADIIKEIVREGETIFEVDGKKYVLSLLEEPGTSVKEDVVHDSELKEKLIKAKDDISNEKVFSTEDVLKMIEQGEI
ncbi:hypothetical protein [Bacillus sp. FJAT-27245]|uniref:hypothetical protein n=1 Tax=Bacillus sp. FJAT-27245 TaxID=1684144 RepID=UPI0006A77820|nr:hypothetical protein [Bacillus sp. FJAT-27245]